MSDEKSYRGQRKAVQQQAESTNQRLKKLASVATLLTKGQVGVVWQALRQRLYSDSLAFGLRRDLTQPLLPPQAAMPLTVRPLRPEDIPALLSLEVPGLAGGQAYLRLSQLRLVDAHLPTCFVAVTSDDQPCYMQWLIGAKENEAVQSYFGGLFPLLSDDEALLEKAYTPEAYRGQRIMACAMAQIAERAQDLGARWAITFVASDNLASLKGCKRAGFVPYLERRERWRLLRRQLTFTPLPEGTPYSFELGAADTTTAIPTATPVAPSSKRDVESRRGL